MVTHLETFEHGRFQKLSETACIRQNLKWVPEASFCRRNTCDTALEPQRSILSSCQHHKVRAHIRHIPCTHKAHVKLKLWTFRWEIKFLFSKIIISTGFRIEPQKRVFVVRTFYRAHFFRNCPYFAFRIKSKSPRNFKHDRKSLISSIKTKKKFLSPISPFSKSAY